MSELQLVQILSKQERYERGNKNAQIRTDMRYLLNFIYFIFTYNKI